LYGFHGRKYKSGARENQLAGDQRRPFQCADQQGKIVIAMAVNSNLLPRNLTPQLKDVMNF
jgi:hypothetical protein